MSDLIKNLNLRRRQRRNMMIGATFSGLLVLVFLIYYSSAQNSQNTLKIVHVLFRHGDRTPTETYRNDPHINYNWPGGWGALTNKGKHQLFELGTRLNKRYESFLKSDFTMTDVFVRSSDADRCHMSGGTFLAGLFPPKEEEVWNSDLLWQPVPIRSLPRNEDNIVAMKKKCFTYDEDLKRAYKSDAIQQINKENEELYKYLTKHAGQNVDNITALEFLFNTLEIEDDNGLELPTWTKSVYPHKLKSLAARSLSIFTETVPMRRMKGGVLIKDIVEHTQKKLENNLKQKMFLYSGHDISLTNVLRALGFVEDFKPEYGAALILEGHSVQNNFEMKLFYYNNTVNNEPYVLKMDACEAPCYFEDFVKVLAPVIPEDWEKECQSH